jgi:hypothetical protein
MSKNTHLPPHATYGMVCYIIGGIFAFAIPGFFPCGGEVIHSFPSSAKDENGWSYSLFPVYAFIASVQTTLPSYLLYPCSANVFIQNTKYGDSTI